MKCAILDTDVGTNVDEALALALIAASPELQVEGVTTVHADALAGCGDNPVIPGASTPLEEPLPEPFHWGPHLWGHEGVGILSSEELVPTDDLDAHAEAAAKSIIEKAAAHLGELSLIAIGPLTNIARALQTDPRLADRILDLTTMGGMLDTSRSDWPPMLETNLQHYMC
jgi:purine nucleosidase